MDSDIAANYELLKNRGNDSFKAKNYEIAIKHYSDAIEIRNDEPAAYSNRAQCYIYLKRFFEALTDCDKALDLNPRYTKALYRRAVTLKQLYRYEGAVDNFKKVLELDPNFQPARDDVKKLESAIQNDTKIELNLCDKPETYRSKKELKIFELNNHYSGSRKY